MAVVLLLQCFLGMSNKSEDILTPEKSKKAPDAFESWCACELKPVDTSANEYEKSEANH